jgi:hypothetical protein
MPDWSEGPYDQYQSDLDERNNANYTTHPALGIVSVVLSVLKFTFFLAMIALAAVCAADNGKPGPDSLLLIVVGLGVCFAPVMALIGLGLGIGSLFQRGSKVCAILGVVFNAMLLLGSILFLLICVIVG